MKAGSKQTSAYSPKLEWDQYKIAPIAYLGRPAKVSYIV